MSVFTVQLRDNNLDFTATPHTPLKRDGVLFITQRRQVNNNYLLGSEIRILGNK